MKYIEDRDPTMNNDWMNDLIDYSIQTVKTLLDRLITLDIRSILAFSLPFILYITTLAPTIYNLDSAELTTAAATGGIVRATGYPLYLTIGYFWTKIPLGDVGFRMNLFSAFCGALTILLADRILRRWQIHPLAAFGALGLLATGTYFWGLSLIAEVYTLHTVFMAALILSIMRWSDNPTPNKMALVGFITGLGLSHHMATILLLPGCLFFILTDRRIKSVASRTLVLGFVGLLVGLGFYLYIPIRYLVSPEFNYAGLYDSRLQFNEVNLLSVNGFFWLISGRVFTGQMFAYTLPSLWNEVQEFAILLSQSFFAFGVAPGLLGMILLFKNNWRQAIMLLLMFVFSAGFYIDYRVLDKDTMYLPAFLIWALWLGYGYQFLITWLNDNLGDVRAQHYGSKLIRGSVLIAVFVALLWNWKIADLSGDYSARDQGERILAVVEENALIFGWWDTVPVVQYLQLVEGQRPDVTAINRFLIPYDDMLIGIRNELGSRPVYINSVSKDILSFSIPRSRGPVYELTTKNQ
jgi:hypothetical protein